MTSSSLDALLREDLIIESNKLRISNDKKVRRELCYCNVTGITTKYLTLLSILKIREVTVFFIMKLLFILTFV